MIWEYLINFFLYTLGMVALIYLAYFYIRVNNPTGGSATGTPGRRPAPPLQIESVLNLEPRKRLYVVSYGKQRFLVATTVEKTELLSTLQEEPLEEIQALPETDIGEPITPQAPISPTAGFMERLQYSVKMVLSDRFPGLGGK